jgi:hypothetical protein
MAYDGQNSISPDRSEDILRVLKDIDERLSFYEERIVQNCLMIEDNRADIERLQDERADD